jgi:2-keto-3-deoxy-L-rhamnonate aldolase RhmA
MNNFRQLLKSAGGQPPIGTWIASASSLVAEAVGHAGFDWAVIDMEHSPLDMMDLVHMLQALAGTKMVPVVRVPWNDAVPVKRVLDAGATTVLFPYIQSADEARAAVASTRYPPVGVRGVSSMSRATRYGTQPTLMRTANQHMGVIAQLETPKGLQALEDIGRVDGVDALFIGPADLAANMGHPGETTHPKVLEAMSGAVQRARALGRPIGTIGGAPDAVAQYRAMQFDFIAVSSDLGLLMRGAQSVVQSLRTADNTSHVHYLSTGTRTD